MSRKSPHAHSTTPAQATPVAGPGSALGQVAAAQREEARKAAEAKALAAVAARFARLDGVEARKAARAAAAAAAAEPVAVSFTDAGVRSAEIVRVYATSGTPYVEALRAAEAAALAAFPLAGIAGAQAHTVSEKLGRETYRFFVRVSLVESSLPGWSGVKPHKAA